MLAMGVPKQAVENKMRMDGIRVSSSCSIPLPPPLPPPIMNPSMLSGIKLKKVGEKKKTEILIKPKMDFRIPSLDQLKIQLAKLRKVDKK